MKKIVCLLLAAVLLLGVVSSAMADASILNIRYAKKVNFGELGISNWKTKASGQALMLCLVMLDMYEQMPGYVVPTAANKYDDFYMCTGDNVSVALIPAGSRYYIALITDDYILAEIQEGTLTTAVALSVYRNYSCKELGGFSGSQISELMSSLCSTYRFSTIPRLFK